MKRFFASVLIVAVSALIIGCDSRAGTTQYKSETKQSQTKDGKTPGETKNTFDQKTTTTPATPDGGGMTTQKTTQTTTETTK
jgi:hypothetical protein